MTRKEPARERLIASPDNPIFKRTLKLLSSSGIKKEGHFLVPGEKLLLEVQSKHPSQVVTVLVDESYAPSFDFPEAKKVFTIKSALFKRLDEIGCGGVMAICSLPELPTWQESDTIEGLEVFLPLSDPGNLGAAIRTCMAFKISKIILSKECAHPFLLKTVKSSAGAVFGAPLCTGPSIKELSSHVAGTYALNQGGENLFVNSPSLPARLILGQEGEGIPAHLSDMKRLTIPISDSVESLNASVALGVALAQLANAKDGFR